MSRRANRNGSHGDAPVAEWSIKTLLQRHNEEAALDWQDERSIRDGE